MFPIAGASLKEVWGDENSNASCNRKTGKAVVRRAKPHTKVYDDIIDSYLDDFNSNPSISQEAPFTRSVNVVSEQDSYNVSPYARQSQLRNPPKCKEDVQPTLSSTFTENALEYERFSKGDHMFPSRSRDAASVVAENMVIDESNQPVYIQAPEQEMDYVGAYAADMASSASNYANNIIPNTLSSTPTSIYIELALYVFSGIILIFVLEQILHLGLYLR